MAWFNRFTDFLDEFVINTGISKLAGDSASYGTNGQS